MQYLGHTYMEKSDIIYMNGTYLYFKTYLLFT